MKIVIDTNVVVSALFFGGKPQRLLHYAINGALEVVVSKEIIEEYYSGQAFLDRKILRKSVFCNRMSIYAQHHAVAPVFQNVEFSL